MKDFQIIPITEAHIVEFRNAVDSVAKEQKYLSFLEAPPVETTAAFIKENLEGNWPHFIAISDGNLIGWCDITSLGRPIFAHSGCLGMAVISGCRGKGVGEALIRTALQAARDKGLTRIELTVRENNKPAIALYEKLGFQVEGLHRNAVCINGVYENHLCMALLFE